MCWGIQKAKTSVHAQRLPHNSCLTFRALTLRTGTPFKINQWSDLHVDLCARQPCPWFSPSSPLARLKVAHCNTADFLFFSAVFCWGWANNWPKSTYSGFAGTWSFPGIDDVYPAETVLPFCNLSSAAHKIVLFCFLRWQILLKFYKGTWAPGERCPRSSKRTFLWQEAASYLLANHVRYKTVSRFNQE